MNYADYGYYSAHYSVIEKEETFERLSFLASRRLDILTGRRAQRASGYKLEALRDCVCNMAEYLYAAESTAQGTGITNVSNEGYSESYQAVTPEQVEENLRSLAFQWLSGTGLMGAM